MRVLNLVQAINEALDLALSRDERVLVFGEDVGRLGGVFRVTEGLQAKYGEKRVFDTPLAESAILGMAIGLAMGGMRPVAAPLPGTGGAPRGGAGPLRRGRPHPGAARRLPRGPPLPHPRGQGGDPLKPGKGQGASPFRH